MAELISMIRRLEKAARSLNTAGEEGDVFTLAVELASEVFGMDVCCLYLKGREDRLELAAQVGFPEVMEREVMDLSEGIMGAVVTGGEAFVTGDVRSVPNYKKRIVDTKSEMACPVFFGGDVVGAIDLQPVDEAIGQIGRGPEATIPLLQAVQKAYRYLPEPALRRIGRPVSRASPRKPTARKQFAPEHPGSPKRPSARLLRQDAPSPAAGCAAFATACRECPVSERSLQYSSCGSLREPPPCRPKCSSLCTSEATTAKKAPIPAAAPMPVGQPCCPQNGHVENAPHSPARPAHQPANLNSGRPKTPALR